ncbi:hypothetical protein MTO96_018497 [Rhipicephalus appendiculatus]
MPQVKTGCSLVATTCLERVQVILISAVARPRGDPFRAPCMEDSDLTLTADGDEMRNDNSTNHYSRAVIAARMTNVTDDCDCDTVCLDLREVERHDEVT